MKDKQQQLADGFRLFNTMVLRDRVTPEVRELCEESYYAGCLHYGKALFSAAEEDRTETVKEIHEEAHAFAEKKIAECCRALNSHLN